MVYKVLDLKLKILKGKKQEVEDEFNEFRKDNKVHFTQSHIATLNNLNSDEWIYTIFVYYEINQNV